MEKQAQLPFPFVGGDKRGSGSGVPSWDVGLGHSPRAGLNGQTLLGQRGHQEGQVGGTRSAAAGALALHSDLHEPTSYVLLPAVLGQLAWG